MEIIEVKNTVTGKNLNLREDQYNSETAERKYTVKNMNRGPGTSGTKKQKWKISVFKLLEYWKGEEKEWGWKNIWKNNEWQLPKFGEKSNTKSKKLSIP